MSKTLKENFWKFFWYLILTAGAITMLIPFFWMVSTSLKDIASVFTYPPQWLPKPVVWRNYIDVCRAFFSDFISILLLLLFPRQ